MIFLQVVCLLIVLVFFVLLVSSIFGISLDSKHAKQRWEALPHVSLLLAARNEEKLILRSLKSIEKLDYPKDKLDVLIGDDQSSDNTKKIIEDFIKDKNNEKVLKYSHNNNIFYAFGCITPTINIIWSATAKIGTNI